MQVSGLELLDQRRSDDESHEDGEESRLHVDIAIAEIPECEGVEEAGDYMEHELALRVLDLSASGIGR